MYLNVLREQMIVVCFKTAAKFGTTWSIIFSRERKLRNSDQVNKTDLV